MMGYKNYERRQQTSTLCRNGLCYSHHTSKIEKLLCKQYTWDIITIKYEHTIHVDKKGKYNMNTLYMYETLYTLYMVVFHS